MSRWILIGVRLFSNMPFRWRVAIGICFIVLIATLAAVIGLPSIYSRSTERLYVRGIEIVDQTVHEMVAASLDAAKYPAVTEDFGTFSQDKFHIGSGTAIVMRTETIRPFSFTTDNADYESVTILFADDAWRWGTHKVGQPSESGSVWAIYAAGSAHYPDHACFGYASEGKIRIDPVSEGVIRISAILHFDGVQMYARRLRSCGKKLIEIRNEFHETTLVEFRARRTNLMQ